MYTKLLKLFKSFRRLEKNRTELKLKHVENRKFASDVQVVRDSAGRPVEEVETIVTIVIRKKMLENKGKGYGLIFSQ